MFDKISQFFGKANKLERSKRQLIRPQFDYLFDKAPSNEWVSLDFEMTGLNPKNDHILSVGAVLIQQEANNFVIHTSRALALICRPPVMPSHETIIIHGLRPVDVENGLNYPTMLEQLLAFIGSRTVVGFCIDMDMAFLNAIVKPYLGVSLANQQIDVSQLYQQNQYQRNSSYIDHMPQPKHLNQLLEEFAIPRLAEHDALNDAIMTAMLFTHLQRQK